MATPKAVTDRQRAEAAGETAAYYACLQSEAVPALYAQPDKASDRAYESARGAAYYARKEAAYCLTWSDEPCAFHRDYSDETRYPEAFRPDGDD